MGSHCQLCKYTTNQVTSQNWKDEYVLKCKFYVKLFDITPSHFSVLCAQSTVDANRQRWSRQFNSQEWKVYVCKCTVKDREVYVTALTEVISGKLWETEVEVCKEDFHLLYIHGI